MRFQDIIGQQEIINHLIDTVRRSRISHAQLFLGAVGSGKLALAVAYAQYLACQNRQEAAGELHGDSCGKCPSCKKYEKLIHPDLHFVFPVASTKSVTKNPVSNDFLPQWRKYVIDNQYVELNNWLSYIGVENKQAAIQKSESAEILKKLNLKTYESEYKVMVIWMPEKMNVTAANKLLKILEEPPDKTLFLLVADSSEQIIRTILSRTQIVKVPKIDDTSMATDVSAKHGISGQQLEDVVRIANGNYLKALNAIKQNDANTLNFNMFTRLMRTAYSRKVPELQVWTDEISKLGREQQKAFLSYCMRLVRENFLLNTAAGEQKKLLRLNSEELAFSQKFARFIHAGNTEKIYQELASAHYHIERYAYGRIVFFDLSLKLKHLLRT